MSVKPARITAALAAIALTISSPAAAAASQQSVNPWLALASFDSASASAVASSTAALQGEEDSGGGVSFVAIGGVLLGFVAFLAIALSDKKAGPALIGTVSPPV